MPPRGNKARQTEETVAQTISETFQESDPSIFRVQRGSREPEQLAFDGIRKSLELSKPLVLAKPDEKTAKQFFHDLRKAAEQLGYGVSVKNPVENSDGTVSVHFQTRTQRKGRKYSTEDVRAWAKENGYDVAETGKVPADVRRAYRIAHGYYVKDA